jgi:hypothetical protein
MAQIKPSNSRPTAVITTPFCGNGFRTLMVYGGTMVFSVVALAPLVGLIRHTTHYQTEAPYISAAVIAIIATISSFFGHKHLSFREPKTVTERCE